MPTDVNIRYFDKVSLQKFYTNSKNKIEDPIFTGFTLDIDTLHSPLFYALAGEEYSESLRSPNGTDDKLSKIIEDKLESIYRINITGNPDSYEISTLRAKDPISSNNERKMGYGLQDYYYLDHLLYGAADYIYMVDKVTDGAYTETVNPETGEGVYDVGNGTPNNSVYEKKGEISNETLAGQQAQEIMNKIGEQIANSYIDEETGELVEAELEYDILSYDEALSREIEKQKNSITDDDRNEHAQNEQVVEAAKTAYETKKKEFDDKTKKYNKFDEDYGNQVNSVKNKFQDYKTLMESYISSLKNGTNKDEYVKKIGDVYAEFETYFNNVKNSSGEYDKVTATITKPNDSVVEKELGNLSEAEKKYQESYRCAIIVTKTSLENIKLNSESQETYDNFKKDINQLNVDLYGSHSDDRMGTTGSPVSGSLYANYQDAKEKVENDTFSKKTRVVEDLTDTRVSLDDIAKYQDVQKTKQVMISNLPTIDTSNSANRYTRPRYEVPQTVYDMMGFINGMKKLTTEYPYVLQTVTGLDEAYKKYFEVKDPYMGSGDGKITINCLEFLDLRVSAMFNKYFNAVYDRQYRRERVPINLRRFNCSIFVHDIRNFRNSMDGGLIPDDGDLSTLADIALNYVSAVEFKFMDCEIIPEETGCIFDNVTNLPNNDMRGTNFTFKYGNCIINFFPFADLKKYVLNKSGNGTKDDTDVQPPVVKDYIGGQGYSSNTDTTDFGNVDDGNFRRWFDKSPLGNVDNNDYRDYIRRDTTVAVDDHYKTTIVNNFVLNSVVDKNRELTAMDDALRRIVVGIAASTTTPTTKVADALNVKFIKPLLTEEDKAAPVIKDLGNMNNSKVVDTHTMEYIGEVDEENKDPKIVNDLGNVNKQ